MILEFRNPWQSHLLKIQSLKLENLWTIKIWCSSLKKCWNSKSSKWQLSLFDTYDEQGNDGRKTRYEVQELLVAEYETDGSMKFITGEDLELVSWQNQRNGTSKLEFDEALQKHLQSTGDFDELSRRIQERFTRNASDRISH